MIDRIKRDGEAHPAAPAAGFTVADLAARYWEAHAEVSCNAQTRHGYRGALGNHILPALGTKPVAEVVRADAEALHYALRATPRAADRALLVLSKMFSLAEDWGLAPPGGNPCRFVARYRKGMRGAVPERGGVPPGGSCAVRAGAGEPDAGAGGGGACG